MLPRTPQRQRFTAAATFCTLIFVTFAAGASEQHVNATDSSLQPQPTASAGSRNFNCPVDCQCVLTENTHKPMLHAKCSSIADLRSDTPLRATLPIHSIDLSYLGLPRLSHSLEKLRDLTSADLSHNELHEIGHLGRRIKKLNLKHNRITSAKLSKLPQHVQVLNLQHNDITQLPLEFTKLTQLQSLELSHNQINCSCETLEVRNWLQSRHVFMEHPVKCMLPAEVKGKPWLQVKQADICDKEKRGWYADAADEENELMLGDQPAIEGSAVHDNEEDDEEELGKAFMPIDQKPSKSAELKLPEDVEGSGDLSEVNLSLELATTTEQPMLLARMEDASSTMTLLADTAKEDEDGSGSGGGILIIPHLARGPLVLDDFDQPDSQEDSNTDDNFDSKPSADIFGNGMGIFDGEKAQEPVTEDEIVPVVQNEELAPANGGEDGGKVTEDIPGDTTEGAATGPIVMQAEAGAKDDGNAIYLLLGVIVLIVIGLILYVGIKRCKKSHRYSRDAENARSTELLDMDKKNLGKPVQRNGNAIEHAPLIGEKTKADLAKPVSGTGKKPYDANDVKDGSTTQQPLLNGNGMPANGTAKGPAESNNIAPEIPRIMDSLGSAPHEYHPITPRYPPPKSPRASKYGHPEPNNNEDVFLPSSPKSGRYSPVYSPETGRVKIKLTETPKPKTPMLVTRSKSNAGDIITTPIRATQLDVPEVDPSRC